MLFYCFKQTHLLPGNVKMIITILFFVKRCAGTVYICIIHFKETAKIPRGLKQSVEIPGIKTGPFHM
jgi:hypothetical protein